MFLPLSDDSTLYAALLTCDPTYDGFAFVGVRNIGVFCRLTCPAYKPKRENTLFLDSIKGCVEADFRPYLRCRSLKRPGAQGPLVSGPLQRLDRQPQRRWLEDDLAALGYSPSTAHRTFKREFGVTFLEMAHLRRLGQVIEWLSSDARVTDAQLDASFNSDSGFYNAFACLLGESPSQLCGHELLKTDWLQTPLGAVSVVADTQALHLLEFFNRPVLSGELKRLQKNSGSSIGFSRFASINRIGAELADYFDSTPVRFQTPSTLNASTFTHAVRQTLRGVPCDNTQDYAELVRSISSPSSVRAVTRVNGVNQITIVVLCHRITDPDGSLTGYGDGLWRKRQLLEYERRIGAAG